ncbi:hypothetical protein HK097_000579 [Rhizophlyctis rosea]|uniref:Uncharacterized protein n=1 Tax=Rhizophlyctis rosea TaxID=64517 RepID=A0AAD5SGI4_9FUNG|nr:hypothetical protein HK097_000579 [Rhizophlyctis rosea]
MVLGKVVLKVEEYERDPSVGSRSNRSMDEPRNVVSSSVKEVAEIPAQKKEVTEVATRPAMPMTETAQPTIWERISWGFKARPVSGSGSGMAVFQTIKATTSAPSAEEPVKEAIVDAKPIPPTPAPTPPPKSPKPPPALTEPAKLSPKPEIPKSKIIETEEDTDFHSTLQPHPDWRCNDGFEVHDFFISYRVATDATLATELALALRTGSIHTYLDKYCLIPGQRWEDGFLQGLLRAKVVLLVVSAAALQRVLTAEKWADNMLLEWEITLDMVDQGLTTAMPLFIGTTTKDSNNKTAVLPFDGWGLAYPDEIHCHKSSPKKRTVKQTMQAIFALQGKNISPLDIGGAVPALRDLLESTHGHALPLSENEITLLKEYLDPVDMTADRQRLRSEYTKGTRRGLLDDLLAVRHSKHRVSDSRVTWLNGESGIGKSVLAAKFMDNLESRSQLGGYFICRYDDVNARSPMALVNTLIYSLAMWRPALGRFILDILSTDVRVREGSVQAKWDKCLCKALASLERTPESLVFVIDGLDECGRENHRSNLLSLFSEGGGAAAWGQAPAASLPSFVSVVVTARPEKDIIASLRSVNQIEMKPMDSKNVIDIEKTVKHRLENLPLEDKEDLIGNICDGAKGSYRKALTMLDKFTSDADIEVPAIEQLLLEESTVGELKWIEQRLAESLDAGLGNHHLLLASIVIGTDITPAILASFTPVDEGALNTLLSKAVQLDHLAFELQAAVRQIPTYNFVVNYLSTQHWTQEICGSTYTSISMSGTASIECANCRSTDWWGLAYSCNGCLQTYAAMGYARQEFFMLCSACGAGTSGSDPMSHANHEKNVLMHPDVDVEKVNKSIGLLTAKYLNHVIRFKPTIFESNMHRRMTVYCLRVLLNLLPTINESANMEDIPLHLTYAASNIFNHWKESAADDVVDANLEAELDAGMLKLFADHFATLLVLYSTMEGWVDIERKAYIVPMVPNFVVLRNLQAWLNLTVSWDGKVPEAPTDVVFNTPSVSRMHINQLLQLFCRLIHTEESEDFKRPLGKLYLTNPFHWAEKFNIILNEFDGSGFAYKEDQEWAQRREERKKAITCLETMHAQLRFNIYNIPLDPLKDYPVPEDEVDATINANLSTELQYALQHWMDHLSECTALLTKDDAMKDPENACLGELLKSFFESEEKTAYFIEAMAFFSTRMVDGYRSATVQNSDEIESWLQGRGDCEGIERFQAAANMDPEKLERFVDNVWCCKNTGNIWENPLHLYFYDIRVNNHNFVTFRKQNPLKKWIYDESDGGFYRKRKPGEWDARGTEDDTDEE